MGRAIELHDFKSGKPIKMNSDMIDMALPEFDDTGNCSDDRGSIIFLASYPKEKPLHVRETRTQVSDMCAGSFQQGGEMKTNDVKKPVFRCYEVSDPDSMGNDLPGELLVFATNNSKARYLAFTLEGWSGHERHSFVGLKVKRCREGDYLYREGLETLDWDNADHRRFLCDKRGYVCADPAEGECMTCPAADVCGGCLARWEGEDGK